MPLFMDVHEIPGGVAMDDVATAHLADLRTQAAYDVRYLRYWVDERGGRVFCLVEAPSAEAAADVHREAHGLVADHIYRVQEGSLVRSKQMRRVRMGLFTGIAAAALGTVMWTVPAWGQSATVAHTGAAGTAVTGGGSRLTNQLAEMRLATAKYATNLNRAKAAGYKVITPMMPNMGIHYMNPSITGFDIPSRRSWSTSTTGASGSSAPWSGCSRACPRRRR